MEESVPATCFPTAAALASTRDSALLTEIGQALAEEAKAQDVGVILGPGVNLKRSPRAAGTTGSSLRPSGQVPWTNPT